MAAWIWVLIPLAAILVGGFKEWLKFKSKQERLGTSTHELEDTVADLRKQLQSSQEERQHLVERVQNLETIVTSEAWDTLHTGPDAKALGDGHADPAERREEPDDAEKAEQMARRMDV